MQESKAMTEVGRFSTSNFYIPLIVAVSWVRRVMSGRKVVSSPFRRECGARSFDAPDPAARYARAQGPERRESHQSRPVR
jgi:hypothetical protein